MKTAFGLVLVAAVALATGPAAHAQNSAPADPKATAKTRRLFSSLQRVRGTGTLFGHQDDLAYGVGWKYEPGRSDVKSVTGSYPAVYGWELGHLELDSAKNLDGVPFNNIRAYVKETYKRGGVNTISWHLTNPTNGKTAWDTTRYSVRAVLPGGASHAQYTQYLDRLARYLRSLHGGLFQRVPVVFRPLHELTGSWFWWGRNECSPEEFKALWRFTVDYLRQEKNVHNLLIAYSTSDFATKEAFLERYPGDGYVDVLGFDAYASANNPTFPQTLDRQLTQLQEMATAHGKIPALTEVGFERIPDPTWWTKTLLPVLASHNMAYVLLWRNGRPDHYYVPYPGQASAEDFKAFYNNDKVIFQNKATPLGIYRK